MQIEKSIFLLFLIFGCFQHSALVAQINATVDSSSFIDIRIPSDSVIENYANNPDFIYNTPPKNPESLLFRIIRFLSNYLLPVIDNPIGGSIFRLLFIAALIYLIVSFINQLMGGELVNIFKNNNSSQGFTLGIEQEALENLNLEELFKQALKENNLHAATRYGYLIALKMLSQNNLITFELQKTNLDYLKELKNKHVKKDFQKLTNYYEFVEYGDFEINTHQFETFHSILKNMSASINEQ